MIIVIAHYSCCFKEQLYL